MTNIEKYMNNYFKGCKNPSLNAMKYLMNEYNNFEKEMKFIHIAGTNGKGSCVEMMNNILINQGYKVGKFISPHLIKYNERISINNKNITDKELEDLIRELEPKVNKYNVINKIPITFFEITTFVALLYFYRKNVDIVILETGLGGLYDCTNIITSPLISIITSIGYDHMHMLGNTLPKIAYQKAGIIKKNSNTVVFEQSEEINQVFIDICKKENNNLHLIYKNQITNYSYDRDYQYFDYKDFKNLIINLKGKKQIENAAICIESIKILNELGYNVTKKNIRNGLKTVIHKARMEVINKKPLVIFDGAHNEPAVENFMNNVKMYYNEDKKIYVVSILKNKNYKKMIELLMKDKEGTFIFTSGNDDNRYISNVEMYNIAKKYLKDEKIYMMDLNEAIKYIIENCVNEVSFFVGSFYVYDYIINEISTNNKK